METFTYGRWRWRPICQRPRRGSRWWRGNFGLGVLVDSHPRFVNVILALVVLEVGIHWERDAVWMSVPDQSVRPEHQ